MDHPFHEELKLLKQKLMQMSFLVDEAVAKACESLLLRDDKLAAEVIEGEEVINNLEIEIDDKGHSLFALGQPMAVDLRLTTMILKMNTDLERIGDHAVNIAEKTLFILKNPEIKMDDSLQKMVYAAQKMLRDALDAFLKEDANLALSVLKRDDEVDNYNRNLYDQLSDIMEAQSSAVEVGINLLMISHNLERIADLACNVAEDVIYLKQGKEVRHHRIRIPQDG